MEACMMLTSPSRKARSAASAGLAAGGLLADRAKVSPAHRSADPEPP